MVAPGLAGRALSEVGGPNAAGGGGVGTIGGMDLLLVAKPWTYWLAPLLTLVSVLGLFAVILGYLVKVVAAKYPKS